SVLAKDLQRLASINSEILRSTSAQDDSRALTMTIALRCRLRFFLQHPRVLAAAALTRIHDEAAFSQRDAREAAGHHDHFFAVEDVRPQVDATAFEMIVDEARVLA